MRNFRQFLMTNSAWLETSELLYIGDDLNTRVRWYFEAVFLSSLSSVNKLLSKTLFGFV